MLPSSSKVDEAFLIDRNVITGTGIAYVRKMGLAGLYKGPNWLVTRCHGYDDDDVGL